VPLPTPGQPRNTHCTFLSAIGRRLTLSSAANGNPAAADGACSVASDVMRLLAAAVAVAEPPEAAARRSRCTAAMGCSGGGGGGLGFGPDRSRRVAAATEMRQGGEWLGEEGGSGGGVEPVYAGPVDRSAPLDGSEGAVRECGSMARGVVD